MGQETKTEKILQELRSGARDGPGIARATGASRALVYKTARVHGFDIVQSNRVSRAMPTLTSKVPAEHLKTIRSIADQNGSKVSTVARELMIEALEQRRQLPPSATSKGSPGLTSPGEPAS